VSAFGLLIAGVSWSPVAELTINEKGIVLEAFGQARTSIKMWWSNSSSKNGSSYVYHGGGDIFRTQLPTGTQGKETKYAAASVTRFPFQFQIPADAPASLNVQDLDTTAMIVYGLTAVAHVSGLLTHNLVIALSLIVSPVYTTQAPAPALLNEVRASATIWVPKFLCFGCCGTEVVQMEARIPRSVFSNGESIPLTIEVGSDRKEACQSLVVTLVHFYTVTADKHTRNINHTVETLTVATNGPPGKSYSVLDAQLPVKHLLPDVALKDLTRASRVLVTCKAGGQDDLVVTGENNDRMRRETRMRKRWNSDMVPSVFASSSP
jgi:hypothetical protein